MNEGLLLIVPLYLLIGYILVQLFIMSHWPKFYPRNSWMEFPIRIICALFWPITISIYVIKIVIEMFQSVFME